MYARPRAWVAAALLTIAAPLAARAQDLVPAPGHDAATAATAVATEAPAAGPTLASASIALRAPSAEPVTAGIRADADRSAPANALSAAAGPSRNQSRALMIVGGAALVAGAIIGDTPGTIIMIGGAGVGLYGLYHYLQ